MMSRNQKWRQTGPSRSGNSGSKCRGGLQCLQPCGREQSPALEWGECEGRSGEGARPGGQVWPCVEAQNHTRDGWVCVLESGDSREVFEKGSGAITQSSEEMHLLMGHSVIELRETRGRKSGQASRSKQQKEVV